MSTTFTISFGETGLNSCVVLIFDNPNPTIKATKAANTVAFTLFMNSLSWSFFKSPSLAFFQKAIGTGLFSSSSLALSESVFPVDEVGGTIESADSSFPFAFSASSIGITGGTTGATDSSFSFVCDSSSTGITGGTIGSADSSFPFAFFVSSIGITGGTNPSFSLFDSSITGSSFTADFLKPSIKLSNVAS